MRVSSPTQHVIDDKTGVCIYTLPHAYILDYESLCTIVCVSREMEHTSTAPCIRGQLVQHR